jgi:DNA modification methylase
VAAQASVKDIDTGAFCQACGAWRGELGLEPTPDLYVAHMVEVFREVRRALTDDGTLWLNLGDSYATGAGRVGEHPGGGAQDARWAGTDRRGGRSDRLDNGRGDQPAELRRKTRATRDGTHAGKHVGMAAMGPMTQPNRLPIPGLKPKDLVGIPWMVAFALRTDGWWLREEIIWAKPNGMPESVTDRCTRAHEYVFHLAKSERYFHESIAIAEPLQSGPSDLKKMRDGGDRYGGKTLTADDPRYKANKGTNIGKKRAVGGRARSGNLKRDIPTNEDGRGIPNDHRGRGIPWENDGSGRNARSVWTITTRPYPGAHFATFPEELARRCIVAGSAPGDTVLDPFGGSGTVAQVATGNGRNAIYIDLNPQYLELAQQRIGPMLVDLG